MHFLKDGELYGGPNLCFNHFPSPLKAMLSRPTPSSHQLRRLSNTFPKLQAAFARLPVSSGELGEALSWDSVVQLESSSLGARF